MKREVVVRVRQRRWLVDREGLTRLTEAFLGEELGLGEWCLGIQLVGERAMSEQNERWLGHEGSTDVITFDHREGPGEALHGELFVSVDDAVRQAEEFGSTPSMELVRYVVHGVLHLQGYDDRDGVSRRAMKRAEDRWVRRLARRFALRELVARLG
ncbi:MAG: rRNA maturation RNase YbeY [Verrucomicrobiae bacterium]|nr:rRNA maturation RNase YbeY [Verrucomicrobiae bacterium]